MCFTLIPLQGSTKTAFLGAEAQGLVGKERRMKKALFGGGSGE